MRPRPAARSVCLSDVRSETYSERAGGRASTINHGMFFPAKTAIEDAVEEKSGRQAAKVEQWNRKTKLLHK